MPECDVWAASEDGQAIFGLVGDGVVFTVGLHDEQGVIVKSRPIDGERLLVRLAWGERTRTETGGTSWATQWYFSYRAEGEARDQWQQLTGLVIHDQFGNERLDKRETFARAIAATAGWTSVS